MESADSRINNLNLRNRLKALVNSVQVQILNRQVCSLSVQQVELSSGGKTGLFSLKAGRG